MTEYTSAIDLAARLIIKKGREVMFSYRSSVPTTEKNVDRPQDKEVPDEHRQKMKMVFIGYEQSAINGTDILQGDEQAYMFAKGSKRRPTKKDMIFEMPKHGGKPMVIIKVQTIAPGEEDVLYILQVRK